MTLNNDEVSAAIDNAGEDEVGRATREELCRVITAAFRSVGRLLWVGGYVIGPDRAEGRSRFKFGSDATVGLGTVVQIAGELCAGTISSLSEDNIYCAAALVRQLVEVEYLAWAFAEDEAEAAKWLRSTKQERLRMWQPHHIRRRSGGRFRGTDYGLHCDRGGHPTPTARSLLPEHSIRERPWVWWLELVVHATSTWGYIESAANRLGYGELVETSAASEGVVDSLRRWRELDRLRHVLAAAGG